MFKSVQSLRKFSLVFFFVHIILFVFVSAVANAGTNTRQRISLSFANASVSDSDSILPISLKQMDKANTGKVLKSKERGL